MKPLSMKCAVCKGETNSHELKPLSLISHPIDDLIRDANSQIDRDAPVCQRCRAKYRRQYVETTLLQGQGEITSLESAVLQSLSKEAIIARNVEAMYAGQITFGQRLADRIASFGGSWAFILIFFSILLVWITINSIILLSPPFDPFPFILLNLVLSCLAAMQAPVIMMSQNRQESKDRIRAEHDYQVNLKAEIEIRHLNMKIDQLLQHQWQRLLDIQKLQLEVLEELEENHSKGVEVSKDKTLSSKTSTEGTEDHPDETN
ncbi:MAG: DUF1003 domain-containing protein [candidate division Zixibacteria bacterium]|nr:DUF1003 domain-containing protein [candidate division Zixibacteria bacterium]